MKRLDQRLVDLGLAPTRTKAQRMIEAGEVEALARGEWRVVTQVSYRTDEARVRDGGVTLKYVSRGGLKLEGGLAGLSIDVSGWRVLDVGLSTGGFTDCVLKRGAKAVLGVDVGHDQLHASLREDPRLTSIEGLHVRDLPEHPIVRAWVQDGVDLAVVDVSFISLDHVLPPLARVLPSGSAAVLLVKPQFETEAARLNRRGVVDDPAVFAEVRARVVRAIDEAQFTLVNYVACDVKGQDGNQEFFAHVQRR